MTEEQIKQKAEEYSTRSKVDYINNIAITLVQQAYKDGAEFGYNKANTKELQEENERLKKDSEENQDLATIAYMQGAGKYKAKLDEAKEIISAYIALVNRLHNVKIFNIDEKLWKKAENFLEKNKH